jgi:glycosyltransferase involved in cell wall biosynthesis
MIADRPLVSIGLPTYNGERYIRDALDSLVAQDYKNIEIVVSDNASSDGTLSVVEGYAMRDARVRVIRQDVNVGAPANFNVVFRESAGSFFMWAADDDRWEPGYVSACLTALLSHPNAVAACSRVRFIDEEGEPIDLDYHLYDNPDLKTASPLLRSRAILRQGGWYQVYGLARRGSLAQTRLFTDTYGSDVVLILELALLGPIVRVPYVLHWYRQLQDRNEGTRATRQGGRASLPNVITCPATHLEQSLSEAVWRSALPLPLRVGIQIEILRQAYILNGPMHERIRGELAVRFREAWQVANLREATRFGVLAALSNASDAGRRLLRNLRKLR